MKEMPEGVCNTVRFSVTLPPWYNRRLCLRARIKGTSRAALAARLIQDGLDATRDEDDASLDAIAQSMGISRTDLEALWTQTQDTED